MPSPQNEDGAHGKRDGPIHRIGMKVVSQKEWEEHQKTQGRHYEKNRKREMDREFDKNQKLEWKGGLEQISEREHRVNQAIDIASEPLSRARNTSSGFREAKQQRRWDDPMNSALSDDSIKPKSFFQAPANRFGISAGYRWDGVVRGNNFEQKWFERINERNSKQKDSYRLD